MSDVANEAVLALLAEDAEDAAAVRDREAEPATSFDAFVAALRSDGAL